MIHNDFSIKTMNTISYFIESIRFDNFSNYFLWDITVHVWIDKWMLYV